MFISHVSKTIFVVLICSSFCFAAELNTAKPVDPNVPTDPNTVIVSYGPEKLTLKEVKYIVPAPTTRDLQGLAENWLDLQLIYDAAQQQGVGSTEKARYLAELNYKQSIARELMNKVAEDVNVTDAQMMEFYEKNKNTDPQLFDPNRYSFTHIRVKTLAEANEALASIKAGKNPSEVAKQMSIAPDAKNGGTVLRMPQMAVERTYGETFANALKAASEGNLIGPIEVKGEYEVARHEGKLSAKVKPFEQVKDVISKNLSSKMKGEATQKFIEDLKKQAASKVVRSVYAQEKSSTAR